jgi:hypothetical protein
MVDNFLECEKSLFLGASSMKPLSLAIALLIASTQLHASLDESATEVLKERESLEAQHQVRQEQQSRLRKKSSNDRSFMRKRKNQIRVSKEERQARRASINN